MKKLLFNYKLGTFWLLFLFILSSAAFAQNTGSISGFVKDKNGTPLLEATVKLSSANGIIKY